MRRFQQEKEMQDRLQYQQQLMSGASTSNQEEIVLDGSPEFEVPYCELH